MHNNLKLNYYQERKYKRLLKTRSINENFFSWLKQFKRIMVRYDLQLKLILIANWIKSPWTFNLTV